MPGRRGSAILVTGIVTFVATGIAVAAGPLSGSSTAADLPSGWPRGAARRRMDQKKFKINVTDGDGEIQVIHRRGAVEADVDLRPTRQADHHHDDRGPHGEAGRHGVFP